MKVFAVIVTYNGESWIRKCLGSLKKSLIPVGRIGLIWFKGYFLRYYQGRILRTMLIESAKNLGFGEANNLGITTSI